MLTDLRLALAILRSPLCWGVALAAVGVTGGAFVGLAMGLRGIILHLNLVDTAWLAQVLGGLGVGVALVAGWLCFPALVSALVGLVADPVATHLERTYYPELGPAQAVPWLDQCRTSFGSFLRAISLNLMLLPVYFIPGVNLVAYLLLNACLLGDDYAKVVVLRRLSRQDAQDFLRANRGYIRRNGAVIALLFLLPGVNMVAPVLATTFAVHRFLRPPDAPLRVALALGPRNVLPTE